MFPSEVQNVIAELSSREGFLLQAVDLSISNEASYSARNRFLERCIVRSRQYHFHNQHRVLLSEWKIHVDSRRTGLRETQNGQRSQEVQI